ncbi:MAG: endonuclease domain-containing protein [Oscillospiraceae bacterium]|jgi:very-short-patch-repair endonuclease|nr:endonuclease domain-containing protein [Oscillospiraceae bacterium]
MSLNYNKALIPRAKELRRNMTPQEKHLWYDFLSKHPLRFQRQKTIDNFIADFYCHVAKLVIEIDGSQHYTSEGLAYDQERTKIFESYGVQVIRFSNREIDTEFTAVCRAIDNAVRGFKCIFTPPTVCGRHPPLGGGLKKPPS